MIGLALAGTLICVTGAVMTNLARTPPLANIGMALAAIGMVVTLLGVVGWLLP